MRIAIIGGVAAGMSAAAKARRTNEAAVITVYDRDRFVSYSGCAMPYYLGGIVPSVESMVPREERFFKAWHNVDVLTRTEVVSINPDNKTLSVKNLDSGEERIDVYDKLIIATGAKPNMPPIKGIDGAHVFVLRNINDIIRIKGYIDEHKVKRAAVIGTGFIGLEVCENLVESGVAVSLIERLNKVTPNLDPDMAMYIEEHVAAHGVAIYKSADIEEITPAQVRLKGGTAIDADFVLVSAGARPDTALATAAGVELGGLGAIKVDKAMRTNVPDIFACGDCAEHYSVITGKPIYRPLGSTANKMGRVAGVNAAGGTAEFGGVLGTAIFKVFEMTAAQTGLTLTEAQAEGYDPEVVYNSKYSRPDIMGGTDIFIKSVADRSTGRVLGAQIIGFDGVDKRIDVLATAITFGAKADDLARLDLAYAPPFANAKDAVIYQGMIHSNSINGGRLVIDPSELKRLIASGEKYLLIDVRSASQFARDHIDTAVNIPLSRLRGALAGLDKDTPTIVYCNVGVTANAAQNVLINSGFGKVYNLTCGINHYRMATKLN